MPESRKPQLPQLSKPQPTTIAPIPTSSAPRSKNTFKLVAMALLLSSLGYVWGYSHGAHLDYESAPMVPIEETGHRGPERSRPGTGADGLGTGP